MKNSLWFESILRVRLAKKYSWLQLNLNYLVYLK